MPRFEFRVHLAVNAESEQDAIKLAEIGLDRVRELRAALPTQNLTVELDEGSADIIEED